MIGKEVLVELLEQRLSAAKIGKILGCSDDMVLYWVRKHGLFPAFPPPSNARERTRSPREMTMSIISAPTDHRRRLKTRAIAYKGGKCALCGYNRCNAALEFHHLDKTTKSFGVSKKGVIRSWNSIERELEKCILVCANYHREVEAGLRTIPGDAYVPLTFP